MWKDKNANGVKVTGEDRYSGVTVILGTGACPSAGSATAVTHGNGAFRFDNLPPGTYCVSVEIQASCGTRSIPKTVTKKTVIVSPESGSDAELFRFTIYDW